MIAAGIQRRVAAANVFDVSRFLPFNCDGARVGWVRRDLAAHLSSYPDVLCVTADAVSMVEHAVDAKTRTAAMAHIASSLAARGLLTPWRNELYEVGAIECDRPCFDIERAAVRFFGFASRAVHLNGLVHVDGSWRMWIGRRSPTKAIDPGMYDNLMGGGVGRGISIEQTLVKEAWEEAGMPSELARRAVPTGTLFVQREVPDGLHVETLHMYDLELPVDFQPVNQDAEVVEFRRLSFEEVVAELSGDAPYTVDAGLVAIECLKRRGALYQ
jgi:8-oxo-dGTP pyrophosphatase MutT (NUDIX family)